MEYPLRLTEKPRAVKDSLTVADMAGYWGRLIQGVLAMLFRPVIGRCSGMNTVHRFIRGIVSILHVAGSLARVPRWRWTARLEILNEEGTR